MSALVSITDSVGRRAMSEKGYDETSPRAARAANRVSDPLRLTLIDADLALDRQRLQRDRTVGSSHKDVSAESET
jgi:hypothetical protein